MVQHQSKSEEESWQTWLDLTWIKLYYENSSMNISVRVSQEGLWSHATSWRHQTAFFFCFHCFNRVTSRNDILCQLPNFLCKLQGQEIKSVSKIYNKHCVFHYHQRVVQFWRSFVLSKCSRGYEIFWHLRPYSNIYVILPLVCLSLHTHTGTHTHTT